jgi:hypothetical protein
MVKGTTDMTMDRRGAGQSRGKTMMRKKQKKKGLGGQGRKRLMYLAAFGRRRSCDMYFANEKAL